MGEGDGVGGGEQRAKGGAQQQLPRAPCRAVFVGGWVGGWFWFVFVFIYLCLWLYLSIDRPIYLSS